MATRGTTVSGASMSVLSGIVLAIFSIATSGCTRAPTPPKAKPPAARVVNIAPDAREVIDRMASFFKSRRGFGLRQVSTTTVGEGNTKHRLAGTVEHRVLVERPNRIFVSLEGDQKGTGIVAGDGNELVIHHKEPNRYESGPSPATIPEIVGKPLVADVLAAGNADSLTRAFFADDPAATVIDGIQELSLAGTEQVDGRECTHLVAVTETGGWDLWVATGDQPVPVRWVPKPIPMFLGGENLDVKSVVTFDQWRIDPASEKSEFTFVPPEGAEKVESLVAAAAPKPRPPRPPAHPLVGKAAPGFNLVGTDGSRFDLAGQKNKIVVLDFWATWCGPCRESLPAIASVGRDYADKGVVFRAVNVKEDGAAVRTFLDETAIDVPVVLDDSGDVASAFRTESIPQTVVIGADGIIQAVHVGAQEGLEARLRRQLDALLAGRSLIQQRSGLGAADEPL